jgi:hypothetical protein
MLQMYSHPKSVLTEELQRLSAAATLNFLTLEKYSDKQILLVTKDAAPHVLALLKHSNRQAPNVYVAGSLNLFTLKKHSDKLILKLL